MCQKKYFIIEILSKMSCKICKCQKNILSLTKKMIKVSNLQDKKMFFSLNFRQKCYVKQKFVKNFHVKFICVKKLRVNFICHKK